MNVSDWLTNIAHGTGFVFYDNMKVIEYPYAGATLYIEVQFTDSNITQTYIYSNQGFSYDGGMTYKPYKCIIKF